MNLCNDPFRFEIPHHIHGQNRPRAVLIPSFSHLSATRARGTSAEPAVFEQEVPKAVAIHKKGPLLDAIPF